MARRARSASVHLDTRRFGLIQKIITKYSSGTAPGSVYLSIVTRRSS